MEKREGGWRGSDGERELEMVRRRTDEEKEIDGVWRGTDG